MNIDNTLIQKLLKLKYLDSFLILFCEQIINFPQNYYSIPIFIFTFYL